MPPELSKRWVRPFFPDKRLLCTKVEWPLERAAFRLLWLLLLLCPFWWWIDSLEPKPPCEKGRARWDQFRAAWVAGWLVLLGAMWLANPGPSVWKLFVALAASLRLLEIMTTGLGTILKQEHQARAHNLVTIVIYAIQVTLIFAILNHSFAATDFVSKEGPASGPFDYLYISWSNVVTIGNTYTPRGDTARFLEVLTTTASVFLFSVLLAFGIDAASKSEEAAAQNS